MPLSKYSDDLKVDDTPELDIVAVYAPLVPASLRRKILSDKQDWECAWRREEPPVEMTVAEIEEQLGIKNLKIMDDYIQAGYDFCFLTARSCEDTVKKAIGDFLKFRDKDGALKELGDSFKKTFSHAVNDTIKDYPGKSDSEKKANVLKKLCKEYDRVVFVDDDKKNVIAARELNIPNLKVIKAWED